jgi:hypothetical protein
MNTDLEKTLNIVRDSGLSPLIIVKLLSTQLSGHDIDSVVELCSMLRFRDRKDVAQESMIFPRRKSVAMTDNLQQQHVNKTENTPADMFRQNPQVENKTRPYSNTKSAKKRSRTNGYVPSKQPIETGLVYRRNNLANKRFGPPNTPAAKRFGPPNTPAVKRFGPPNTPAAKRCVPSRQPTKVGFVYGRNEATKRFGPPNMHAPIETPCVNVVYPFANSCDKDRLPIKKQRIRTEVTRKPILRNVCPLDMSLDDLITLWGYNNSESANRENLSEDEHDENITKEMLDEELENYRRKYTIY